MNQVDTSKRELPGRTYMMLVTALATVLIATPLMFRASGKWEAVAVVHHAPLSGGLQPIGFLRELVEPAAESVGLAIGTVGETPTGQHRSKLSSNLRVITHDGKSPDKKRTAIRFRCGDGEQARQFVNVLASDLSTADKSGTASIAPTRLTQNHQIAKRRFLTLLAYAVVMGVVTLLFPRPKASRQNNKKQQDNKKLLDSVSDAVGVPVIGAVFHAKVATTKRKSKNVPLRLTAFAAEIVVVLAFLLMLYNTATVRRFNSRLWKNPLGTYSQTMHNTGSQIESLLKP